MTRQKFIEHLKRYRFELRHITVLFIVLVFFQIILSIIQKQSLQNFLENTQQWYQQDSAEKIAHLATTSMELLLENVDIRNIDSDYEQRKIIQSFNIIFSQQLLEKNIEDICLIVNIENQEVAIDDGTTLFNFLHDPNKLEITAATRHQPALSAYKKIKESIKLDERIYSIIEGEQTFHTFVPFVPNGEYQGVLYVRKQPDLHNITGEIISSYEETAIIYSSLILFGLLAMYYISSYTLKERNEAQKKLYEEYERHLKEQIIHEKESLFTKRIYHTHHKAEKVMGFIKEDLRKLSEENSQEIIDRVTKYSNFISRVIYDMKWYDPPVHTVRGQMFDTNINEVIKFLVDQLFLRISSKTESFTFKLELDEKLPNVQINQFVVWEIFEPLIQNCIDHANVEKIEIYITTKFDADKKLSIITISDNGKGFNPKLLEKNSEGQKLLFSENVSTKIYDNQNSGYGCYIAYQIGVKRCGWELDASNKNDGGAAFIIKIHDRAVNEKQ
ncbi:MAG: ATP-binding protein [Melioribacteraceae bacterium]|nr:MAG: ATP-binding protein [Melioribacteraceae bacterium]